MIQTLNRFSSESLFDATSHLLHKLNIEFDRDTAESIDVAGLYDGPMPKYLTDALESINDTYYIGIVNDKSLAGAKNADSLEYVAETIQHGGKYDGMFVFACDAKQDANLTRTAAAALTRAFNRLATANPVILIIRQNNLLSLSTCERRNYSQEWRQGSGEKLGKVSILRNINCVKPHRGHIDILKSLGDKPYSTFEDLYKHWMEVFNSELLTKQFYNDLFDWYQWAVAPETNVTFPGDVETQEDDREDIDTRVIRLITRLMFVWFIKQKDLVPACIFDEKYLATILKNFNAQSSTDSNYYQAILQNLFFGTLNRPIIEDGERREFAQANTADVKNLYRYSELFSITEDEVIDLFSTVPFLNCGLFECQDKTKKLDGVEHRYYYDGFSRNDRKKNGVFLYRAFVPNILFFHPTKGLISIFNRYVFTIEENTPQDVQVALDPELLGKVFENLLGAYNPETKETARNESGSFYTPREIVQYMVNESLVAHLKQTVGEDLEIQYRQLLDFTTEEVELTAEQKDKILHALFTCKILDPACGSGAFPMGMLQQMVHILQQVDPDNTMWREVLTNLAVDESRRAFGIVDEEERRKKLLEIEETFNNGLNSPDYTRKLYIIESCIYGVDIQPIAMLISRLRFFITLICEQTDIQREKPELNFGIKTLPNLESKFVAANSLINADIHQYNEDWTQDEVLTLLKNELLTIRHRHFYTRKRSEKIRLLREDEAKRKQIHQHIKRLVGEPNEEKIKMLSQQITENEKLLALYQGDDWVEEAVQTDLFSPPKIIKVNRNQRERDRIKSVIAACRRDIEREQNKCTPQGFEAAVLQVTDWNPYDQNSVSPFLDIEWMFGVTDGFDIVIGNPPYIQLQADKGKLANLYSLCGFKTFNRGGDIYCLFYERGNQLLKDKGSLCYITSNKWMRAGYGEELRGYLTTETNPKLLIDFGETHVFESATVMTNILLFQNSLKREYIHATQILEDFTNPCTLNDYVKLHNINCQFEGGDNWVIMSDTMRKIKKKVEDVGIPLAKWEINIYRGILTGYDKAFWIDSTKREEILSWCSSEKEREETSKLICPLLRGKDINKYGYKWANIWLISTFPSRNYNIDDYPAIKRYLQSFPIEKLEQTGAKHYINGELIKSRKKTRGKWYELQDTIAYWKEFDKPKIVYPETTKFMPFVFDDKHFLANKTCFIMVGKYLFYLVAFFNSSLFKYCFRDDFGALFGGARGMSKIFFDKIPVLEVDDDTDAEFRELVLDIQNEYSDEKAKAIDQRIFDLYGLTQEEREAIGYIDFHSNNDNETEDNE
ncbi:MAG: Eco57I restriction-modification methylase domain-containing protein [Prevotella sp.]|nr:Eco57I restriction-modification methylase domain-containing protein [Prevotella sp.]